MPQDASTPGGCRSPWCRREAVERQADRGGRRHRARADQRRDRRRRVAERDHAVGPAQRPRVRTGWQRTEPAVRSGGVVRGSSSQVSRARSATARSGVRPATADSGGRSPHPSRTRSYRGIGGDHDRNAYDQVSEPGLPRRCHAVRHGAAVRSRPITATVDVVAVTVPRLTKFGPPTRAFFGPGSRPTPLGSDRSQRAYEPVGPSLHQKELPPWHKAP